MTPTTIQKERLSTKEAADFFGCAESTLKISRVTGLLLGSPAPTYYKIGRKVSYSRTTCQGWLDQFSPQKSTAESTLRDLKNSLDDNEARK
jgi:hypothetical protein